MNIITPIVFILISIYVVHFEWITKQMPKKPSFSDGVVKFAMSAEAEVLCPPDYVIVRNYSHIPSSNGCGTDSIKLEKSLLHNDNQEECCNSHDICYDTCYTLSSNDADKYLKYCDLKFKSCLYHTCSPFYNNENEECKQMAEFLYGAVNKFGKFAYEQSQALACSCVSDVEYGVWIVFKILLAFVILIIVLWVRSRWL